MMYVTVIAMNKFHGDKPLCLKKIVKLIKEPDNRHDSEAIACEMRYFGKIGYLANSTNTVIKGCMSAGRVYDKINNEYFAKIIFIKNNYAIAKVLDSDEYISEIENPESDIHYLSENLSESEIEYSGDEGNDKYWDGY